jgi:hypothetical protein
VKQPGEQAEGDKTNAAVELQRQVGRVWCVQDIYLRNTIVFLTTKLQLFNQSELSNRFMPEMIRQEWVDALGRLIALLKARSGSAILVPRC